jgi:hypothetical protein
MFRGVSLAGMIFASLMLAAFIFLWAGLSLAGTPQPDPPNKNIKIDQLSPQPEPPDKSPKVKDIKPRPSPEVKTRDSKALGPQPEPPDKTIKKGVTKSVK